MRCWCAPPPRTRLGLSWRATVSTMPGIKVLQSVVDAIEERLKEEKSKD